MLAHALEYVALGWPVFPCDPASKAPHRLLGQTGGFHHATLDAAQIWAWWRAAPDALIGSAASFAIDIDTPEGMETAKSIGLRAGAIVRTGNGWHAHFGPISRLRPKGTVAGLTIRPVGRAYVILPPSLHPSGKRYEWVGRVEKPSLSVLPELPQKALDLIAPPLEPVRRIRRSAQSHGQITPGMRRHVERILDGLKGAEVGSRHPAAVAAAVHLAKIEDEHGLASGTFRAELEEAALACGLEPSEVTGDGYRTGLVDWAWDSAA